MSSRIEFDRVYTEHTQFRYADPGEVEPQNAPAEMKRRVFIHTDVWFCQTTNAMILKLRAEGDDEQAFLPEGDDLTGTVFREGLRASSAVRIAIMAHDRLIDAVRARLPENAERVS